MNLTELNKKDVEYVKLINRIMLDIEKTPEHHEMKTVLSRLAQKVESSKKAKKFLKTDAQLLKNRFDKSANRGFSLKGLVENSKLHDSKLATLKKAFDYLGLFETTVTNEIDVVLMFLIATGHDFYVPWKRRYAKKLKHLDDASLAEKLAFLDFHDLQIFSRNINRTLRNKVAHMDFDIEPDGRISVENQTFDLDKELNKLIIFVLSVARASSDSGMSKILMELA